MIIIGIDPGPDECGVCEIDTEKKEDCGIIFSEKVLTQVMLARLMNLKQIYTKDYYIVCEDVSHYGMSVGKSVFDTAKIIGRIEQICSMFNFALKLYERREYGRWFVVSGTLNDSSLRTALEYAFGGYTKGQPLHRLRGASDKRTAFALAKYHENELRLIREGLKPAPQFKTS